MSEFSGFSSMKEMEKPKGINEVSGIIDQNGCKLGACTVHSLYRWHICIVSYRKGQIIYKREKGKQPFCSTLIRILFGAIHFFKDKPIRQATNASLVRDNKWHLTSYSL